MSALRRVLVCWLVLLATSAPAAAAHSFRKTPAPLLAGVAIDRSGQVYVADSRKGRVYLLSDNLQLRAIWTIPRPTGPSDVHLAGIAVGRSGAVYVTDIDGRIFKLTPAGRVRAKWGTSGTSLGQFLQPWGIGIDSDGNVLVADGFNHRVQKFSPTGRPLAQWRVFSSRDFPGGPCGLQYLAVGPHGRVYVSDDCYNRVFVLASSGKVLRAVGQVGHRMGRFSGVAGVAVGPHGVLAVAETFRILRFSTAGKRLDSIRETGFPGYPFSPAGMAIDRHGDIIVADAENFRVLKLSPTGRTLAIRCLRSAGCKGGYASGS